MNRWLILVVAIAAIGSGCVRTINPVLKDEQVTADNTLAGTWVATDPPPANAADKAVVFAAQPAGTDKKWNAVFTDENGKKSSLVGRLGKIGEVEVIELQANPAQLDKVGDYAKGLLLPLYYPVVIQPTDANHVTAWGLDFDWFKKYVGAHPDELQVVKGKEDDDIVVSAPTDDFQKFLIKHLKDDGAMKKVTWTRQGAATQPGAGG
jgi:hypothetical protein